MEKEGVINPDEQQSTTSGPKWYYFLAALMLLGPLLGVAVLIAWYFLKTLFYIAFPKNEPEEVEAEFQKKV